MFKVLKFIVYISSLAACYFAYTSTISWWWVLALIAVTAFLRIRATASKTALLTTADSTCSKDEIGGPTDFELEAAKEKVMEFGQAMMEVDYLNKMHDVSSLPSEKGKILESFVTLYRAASDDKNRDRFKLGLLALSRFQDGIGMEPVEISLDPNTYANAEEEYARYCLELDSQRE